MTADKTINTVEAMRALTTKVILEKKLGPALAEILADLEKNSDLFDPWYAANAPLTEQDAREMIEESLAFALRDDR